MRRKSVHPHLPEPEPKSKPSMPVPIPEHWSAAQALAVYDFCSAVQELVWRRYRDVLIDPMLQAQLRAPGSSHTEAFDDDPPF